MSRRYVALSAWAESPGNGGNQPPMRNSLSPIPKIVLRGSCCAGAGCDASKTAQASVAAVSFPTAAIPGDLRRIMALSHLRLGVLQKRRRRGAAPPVKARINTVALLENDRHAGEH